MSPNPFQSLPARERGPQRVHRIARLSERPSTSTCTSTR